MLYQNKIIGFEAQRLFRAKKHGMDIVALELLKELDQIPLDFQLYVFVAKGPDVCFQPTNPNIHLIQSTKLPYPIWEQMMLPFLCKKYKINSLHCTSNTFPLVVNNIILTLHDVIFLETKMSSYSNWFQKFGNLYRKVILEYGQSRITNCITVSHYEKATILSTLPKLKNKVDVIYNSVGAHFFWKHDAFEISNFKQKHNLPNQYFIHFSNSDPKKNTFRILSAYKAYVERRGDLAIPLVLLDSNFDFISPLIAELELAPFVIILPYVDNLELPKLYQGGKALLYASIRESFGIPILEAQASGIPVITSHTSCLPEVAGREALFVDPYSIESITKGIEEAEQYGPQLYTNTNRFSWKKSANQLAKLYATVN